MFFVASKVFWTLAQPLSIITLLVLAAVVLGAFGRRRLALTANGAALFLLALLCFTNLGAVLIRPLEDRFPRGGPPENISAIIILGGATESAVSASRGTAELNSAAERMTEAVALVRRYPSVPLVFSGGVGSLAAGSETEADTAERFFIAQGVDPSVLMLEREARNTAENAALIAGMIETTGEPALLVTSAFHMPRSVGLFRQEGFDVLPWPVDYRSAAGTGFTLDFGDPVKNLDEATTALREWVGLLAYRLTGQIADVFPGP